MRVLLWHVHGSWTTAFVQGDHEYLVPVDAGRSADGRGRADTWTWPDRVREIPVERLGSEEIDVVLLQRPHEEALATSWSGRRPGTDLPAVYLEHNAPQAAIAGMRHPMADRADVRVVHVTHCNDLFWDTGRTSTSVIEHGVPDPGHRYRGELLRAAVVVNEPGRRDRVVGADLYPRIAETVPLDLFGMGCARHAEALASAGSPVVGHENLPQARLHDEVPRRRVYVHPFRWTSLGLSLIEAMLLGMPVVALATTEATRAVPPGAGIVSTCVEDLLAGTRELLGDREAAEAMGRCGRRAALERYGLERFLADWDALLDETVTEHRRRVAGGRRVG